MAIPRTDDASGDPEEAVRAEVRRHAAAVLNAVGPLDADRLCRVLERAGTFAPMADEGWDDDDHRWMVEDLVEFDMDDFHATADGLIAHIPSLVDGIVLTHVLTADEQRRSMIDLGIDLAVLGRHRFRYDLVAGGQAHIVRDWGSAKATEAVAALGLPTHDEADRQGSLLDHTGWLDRFVAGDLIALRVSDRTLELGGGRTHPPSQAPSAALVAALEAAAHGRIETEAIDEDGLFVLSDHPEHLVLDAMAHDPTLFRTPGPPLAEVFATLGLFMERDTLLWRKAAG